jgi:4-amino-4-deoxy-L-arabinose transferase-like glycosyltransferase
MYPVARNSPQAGAMTELLYGVSAPTFLILAVLVATLPFLDARTLRMAGDEKVYVTTAVEMARDGRWFTQTLADEPNYFKGPLHYLFLRVGLLVFGDRLIAGTWMNALVALLAGLAMYQLGRKRWNDKSGLLLGIATALNVGAFSYSIVSQMEVEVFAFYALATAALGLASTKSAYWRDLPFWLAAALAGWSKSPLLSVLIGSGAITYWALSSQLASRARDYRAWLAALTGVAVCALGYLPAALLDWKNVYETFILREQLTKASNQHSWHYVMRPLLHFTLPWTFVVLAAILKTVKAARCTPASVDVPMIKLGLGMAMPTVLFWCLWTYKNQTYTLPVIPALLLFAWAAFNGTLPKLTTRLAGALGVLVFLAAAAFIFHFAPLPEWWSRTWLFVAFVGILAYVAAFLMSEDVRVLGVGTVGLFVAFGAFITPPGEREMRDIREHVRENPGSTYYYYNLDPSIWSEWALLQLTLHRPIKGLHRPQQLAEATRPGHVVLVQNRDNLNVVLDYWRKHAGQRSNHPEITPWRRWLNKGKTPDGKSRLKAAWANRDLTQLEREYYIVRFD